MISWSSNQYPVVWDDLGRLNSRPIKSSLQLTSNNWAHLCVCVGGGGVALYVCFAKVARMIVGEYEQRSVNKRYNVVGNGPDSVLAISSAIYCVN